MAYQSDDVGGAPECAPTAPLHGPKLRPSGPTEPVFVSEMPVTSLVIGVGNSVLAIAGREDDQRAESANVRKVKKFCIVANDVHQSGVTLGAWDGPAPTIGPCEAFETWRWLPGIQVQAVGCTSSASASAQRPSRS